LFRLEFVNDYVHTAARTGVIMAQAQAAERGTTRDDARRPSMIVLEVAEPSKHEIYRRLAEMPGVRVLIVEEPPPMP
jgi:hypothetical protein